MYSIYLVITMEVQDGNYIENSRAPLLCRATGVPIPDISWYFNNTKLTNNGKYIIPTSTHPGMGSTLIILLSSYDAGTYTCKATNIAGSVTSSGTVTVWGKQ